MWKSVIYKEWLKTRWFLIGLTVIGLTIVGNMFLNVQHDILFREAHNYWYFMLFQGFTFTGGLFKYILLITGIGIGVAQFVPEIVNKRIKLTFHLPINENKILTMMLSYGFACLILSYLIIYALFMGLSHKYFAPEMVSTLHASIMPWFLAGFAAYFLGALLVMEPLWKYRLFYLIVIYFFITMFLEYQVPGGYGNINGKLAVLTLMTSVSLLFSAYRFRKGEM